MSLFEWIRKSKSSAPDATLVTETPACPKCGSDQVIPVLYGLPSKEAMEAGRRGELAFGGCCLPPQWSDMNRWCCKQCQFRWSGNPQDSSAGSPQSSINS